MGRIGIGDVEKYQSGSRGFFSLADDKDVASVRFLYESEDDLDIFSVHKIKVGEQEKYVNCLRESPNDPESKCPLCSHGNGRFVRLFLQLAQVTEFDPKSKDDVSWDSKVWDRGPQFAKKLQGICSRYNPLCGTMFEIERQGKKGDTGTDYGIYPIKTDGLKLEELPEKKSILGSVVLDKSYEDLDAFVITGQFPDESSDDDKEVSRRGNRQEVKQEVQEERADSRRQEEPEENHHMNSRRRC